MEQSTVLSASSVNGDNVRNLDGDNLGKIEEIMIDIEEGRISYAVLSFGGILGFGNKLFAIPWNALTLDRRDKEFILDVSEDKLENAPGFDKNDWPDSGNRTWLREVYSYYGSEPYWS